MSRNELRDVARLVGVLARGALLFPEDLVIQIRASWETHPEGPDVRRRQTIDGLVTEFISLCVVEYYRTNDRQTTAHPASSYVVGRGESGART